MIGINESIDSTSGGNQGLGFAVPIDTARNSLEQIVKNGHVDYAWMGVTLETLTPDLAKTFKYSVGRARSWPQSGRQPGGQGRHQGRQLDRHRTSREFTVGGDVITAVNGKSVSSAEDLVQAIAAYKPGDTVEVTIDRHGTTSTVKVTLGTRPANL